jgi:hypothetical protein
LKSIWLTGVALLLACGSGSSAWSQTDRGTITGTVTDSSGAVVPNAKVTAKATTTGEERSTTTSGEGDYTLPELPAAPYQVTAEAQGFKKSTQSLQLPVQVTRRADFKLTVGVATETTTVIAADVSVLQTESAVSQTNVSERQVRQLPLQVTAEAKGRTPLAFIFLDSTVTSSTEDSGQTAGTNATKFRVNGGQALGTEILVDGSSTRRAQNGTFFTEVAPGPDAYQEFTLSTSSYSSEFGSSSGGVVNFTIKSGSNGFHGEAYDLLRNTVLDANSFLANASNLPRGVDRQNDFGANIGGPVIIPGLYNGRNKSFFFFNYEGYRFTQGENVLLTVPTLKMKTGDFSELLTDPYVLAFNGGNPIQIYDPTMPSGSRNPIPGNRLDVYSNPGTGLSVLDPVGLGIVAKYPDPNRDGVFHNYSASSSTPITMNSYVAKGDQVISDRQHLSGSYTTRSADNFQGGFPRFPLPFIADGRWKQIFNSKFARIQHDYTFSQNLLNHLNLGWSRVDVSNKNTTFGFNPGTQLGMNPLATQNVAFPRIGIPGYGSELTSPDPRAYQPIGSTFFSDRIFDNTLQISDGLTWVKGRHTLKFGGDVRWQQENVTQVIDPGGTFNFRNDQSTSDADPGGGWPIASLVTGATEFSFVTIHSVSPGWRFFFPAMYANDDIKVTPRLTLNLGVRYEIPNPRTEMDNRYRAFDPNVINPDVNLRGALIGAGGQGGIKSPERGLIPTDYSNFSPRVGFAFSLNSKSVIRGGFGLYYSPFIYGAEGQNNITDGLQGYSTSRLSTPNGRNSTLFLNNLPNAPAPNPNSQFVFDAGGNFLATDVDYLNRDFHTGRTAQWSFDFQHELPANLAFTLGYVGHKGSRLRSNFVRLNALPLADLKLGFPILNESLNTAIADPATVAYAASIGVPLPSSPDAVFPGFDGNFSVAQALRPFPQYHRVRNLLESRGESWYHGFNARLSRSFAKGFQFSAAYTWSKLITNAADDLEGGSPIRGVLQNPFNLSSLRTVDPGSAAHVFVINYIWELPFGKGKPLLNQPGVVDKIVGGWQINGIQRYESGLPLVPSFSGQKAAFLDLVGYEGNLRPNLTGQPILTGNKARGVTYQAVNPAAFAKPVDYTAPPGNPTPKPGDPAYAQFYANTAQFFGTAPPVLSKARLYPFALENFSVLKRTGLTERFILEFRTEVFNAFNRHRYFLPNVDLNCGCFGQAGVSDSYTPRSLQIGLKLIY